MVHLQNLRFVKAFQIKLVWWSPSPRLDVALLQTLQKSGSFLPSSAYLSASTNASVADGWTAGLPTTCPLPFCLLCHFAILPADADGQSRTKLRTVQLQLSYWLANQKCPSNNNGNSQSQIIHFDMASLYSDRTRIDIAINAPKSWIFEQDS